MSRRLVARALLLAPALAVAGLAMAGSTASPASATVARQDDGGGSGGGSGGSGSGGTGNPILECSFHDTKTGKYNTLWGYSNKTGYVVDLPVSAYNRFNSPAANAGQPTHFLTGTHDNVFIVTSTGSSSWTLGTVTVTAPGKVCATNPVPFLPGDVPAWVAIGALMAAILAGGLVVQRRLQQVAVR